MAILSPPVHLSSMARRVKFGFMKVLSVVPKYNQQDATFLDLFISTDALHVSGGSSSHHQKHKTVQYSFRYRQPVLLLAASVDEVVRTYSTAWPSLDGRAVPWP